MIYSEIEFPRWVFRKHPSDVGKGVSYDQVIVNNMKEYEAEIANGYSHDIETALEQGKIPAGPGFGDNPPDEFEHDVSRAELEAKATELGIKFDRRTSDRKLLAAIEGA